MKDIIRMNQLAGLITEGQARKMMAVLNENLDFSKRKTRIKEAEGVFPKDIKVDIDEDEVNISSSSGDYSGFIEDDGKVSFSVTYDEDEFEEEGYPDGFDDDNWKDILGPKHAFVKIINSIGGDVEALDDYVMITIDSSKLSKF